LFSDRIRLSGWRKQKGGGKRLRETETITGQEEKKKSTLNPAVRHENHHKGSHQVKVTSLKKSIKWGGKFRGDHGDTKKTPAEGNGKEKDAHTSKKDALGVCNLDIAYQNQSSKERVCTNCWPNCV